MANKTQTIAKTAAATAPKAKAAPKANPAAAKGAQALTTAAAKATAPKAANKPSKASQAAAAKVAPVVQAPTGAASIVAMVVEGIKTRIEAKSAFYATALSYHARMKTQFPRARNNEVRASLKTEDVARVFEQHDKKVLASGNATGQAMFDIYMMEKTA